MPSKSSSRKVHSSVLHDIFPKILGKNAFNSKSTLSDVFRRGWPPLSQVQENDQIKAIKEMMRASNREMAVSARDLEDLLRYERVRVV